MFSKKDLENFAKKAYANRLAKYELKKKANNKKKRGTMPIPHGRDFFIISWLII